MDGTMNLTLATLTSVAKQAMRDEVSLQELRVRIWAWGKQCGWYHTTVEVMDGTIYISYYPSLSAGLEKEEVPMPASYWATLPSSNW